MGGSSMSIEKTYDPVTSTYKFTTFAIVHSMVGGSITGGDDLSEYIYHDGQTPPTDAEVKAENDRLQAEYDAQEYARDRQSEYPSIQDQLDYIYHNSITKWKSDMIKPVKDAHPKP
jgi:hypothetical protein